MPAARLPPPRGPGGWLLSYPCDSFSNMRTSDRSVALAMLEMAARTLDEVDLARAPEPELDDDIGALWQAICRLQAQLVHRLAVWRVRATPRRDGAPSLVAWLRHRLRLDDEEAGRLAALTMVEGLPVLDAAYRAGDVSGAHVAAIHCASRRLGREVLAGGGESMLVDVARREPPASVRRLAARLQERLDPAGSLERRCEERARRWLWVERAHDGSVIVHGVLDPAGGEALLATGADEPADPQMRADVLVAALRSADRPQVTVTVPLSALRAAPRSGGGVLGSGEPVDAATARRLACDAEVLPAVLGSLSEPLDVGRHTRTVPAGLRAALAVRDGGCRFPGCHTPAGRCLAHHVRHWADGGRTVLGNLVLLCEYHHGAVHEDGWALELDALTREVRAIRPDGTALDAVSMPVDRAAWG